MQKNTKNKLEYEHKNEGCECAECTTRIFKEHEPFWRQKAIRIIILTGMIFGIGLYLEFLTDQYLLVQILFLAVVAISGHKIIRKGISSILRKSLDINFLMSVASIGAFSIGHGEEGAAVIFY